MTRQHIFLTLAVITAIPALLMMANLTMFAFIGYGFLPEGNSDMNAARGVITWLSSMAAIVLFMGTIR
jgi:hypothetical protein